MDIAFHVYIHDWVVCRCSSCRSLLVTIRACRGYQRYVTRFIDLSWTDLTVYAHSYYHTN
ncbi:hypothetical protein B834_1920 [Enterococcus mundtii 1A]|nr:hypothetical protein [Enterococcus mundtii 1A]